MKNFDMVRFFLIHFLFAQRQDAVWLRSLLNLLGAGNPAPAIMNKAG